MSWCCLCALPSLPGLMLIFALEKLTAKSSNCKGFLHAGFLPAQTRESRDQ